MSDWKYQNTETPDIPPTNPTIRFCESERSFHRYFYSDSETPAHSGKSHHTDSDMFQTEHPQRSQDFEIILLNHSHGCNMPKAYWRP